MSEYLMRRLNLLYDSLTEIRQNIREIADMHQPSFNNENQELYALSYDQRFMIDLYTTMYNASVRQIDYIHRELQYYETLTTDNSNRLFINGRTYTIEQVNTQPVRNEPSIFPANNIVNNTINNNPFSPLFSQGQGIRGTRGTRNVATNATNATNATAPRNAGPNTGLDNLLTEVIRQFNQPIVVRPSSIEIENATREAAFEFIEDPPNSSCPICLDEFQDETQVTEIIPCGHLFIPREINRWFETNVRCPVCRYDIRNYVGLSSSTRIRSRSRSQSISNPGGMQRENNDNIDRDRIDRDNIDNDNIDRIDRIDRDNIDDNIDDDDLTNDIANAAATASATLNLLNNSMNSMNIPFNITTPFNTNTHTGFNTPINIPDGFATQILQNLFNNTSFDFSGNDISGNEPIMIIDATFHL